MKVRISVTRSHIENGRPGCTISCPVALAAESAGLDAVVVGCDHMFFNHGQSLRKIIILGDGIRSWITDFDEAVVVYPFSFEIDTDKGIVLAEVYA